MPFSICFYLLSPRRAQSIAAGAGVACAFFGVFSVVSPFVGMVVLLLGTSGWGTSNIDPKMKAAEVALVTFFASSLSIVWSGARIGRAQWSMFRTGIGATVLYMLFGFGFLASVSTTMGIHAQREKERADRNVPMSTGLARQTIRAIAVCLFRNHMQKPQAGYPASLDPPPNDWTCDTRFAADAVPEHRLAYDPARDLSGSITDFELSAVPYARGVNERDPIMIDNRGLLFVYYGWSREAADPKAVTVSSDLLYSQIKFLRTNVEQFIKYKNQGLAPAALNPDAIGSLGHEIPSIEDGGLRLETRDYETRYFPPPADDATKFALSAQCKSYGMNCLRSYFADYDGKIHGTSEPRQATANDPFIGPCENASGECADLDWFP